MSVKQADFQGEVIITCLIHYANPNLVADLTAIATALGTDTTTHDKTIEAPPLALKVGAPGNDRLTNDILLLVNIGKGGNLPVATMASVISAVAAAPPVPPH